MHIWPLKLADSPLVCVCVCLCVCPTTKQWWHRGQGVWLGVGHQRHAYTSSLCPLQYVILCVQIHGQTSTRQCMCMLLQVRAIDNGSPSRHTDHSLTINILDVNDNAPVIESQRGYNVSISEVGTHSHGAWALLFYPVHDLLVDLHVSIVLYVSSSWTEGEQCHKHWYDWWFSVWVTGLCLFYQKQSVMKLLL